MAAASFPRQGGVKDGTRSAVARVFNPHLELADCLYIEIRSTDCKVVRLAVVGVAENQTGIDKERQNTWISQRLVGYLA